MILLDPESDYMNYHSALYLREPKDLLPVIKTTTQRALDSGVEIRWYRRPIPFSLLIGDPESQSGRIRVELPIPYEAVSSRPSIYIERGDPLFGVFLKHFQETWDHSQSVTRL